VHRRAVPWPHLITVVTGLAAVATVLPSLPASVRVVVLLVGLGASVLAAVPRGAWVSSVVVALPVVGLAIGEPRPALGRVLAVVVLVALHLWARAAIETGVPAAARLLPRLVAGGLAAVPVAWLGHQHWPPSLGWFLAGLVASLAAYVVVTR
jgi:hypothetical protein